MQLYYDNGSSMWGNPYNLLVCTILKLKGKDQNGHHNIILFPNGNGVAVQEPTRLNASNPFQTIKYT